jgi:hypothetical protein
MQMTQSYAVELDIEPAQNMSISMGSGMGAGNSQPQNSTAGMNMSSGSMPNGMATGIRSSATSNTTMGGQSTPMSGEAMVAMPGMAMPQMNTTDQGQPVNHHLEVHLKDASTGNVLSSPVPTISITDSGGNTWQVSNVVPMYDPSVGQSDLHFGNNVYLPDGTYTVTVMVGPEIATFANVTVSGGATGS